MDRRMTNDHHPTNDINRIDPDKEGVESRFSDGPRAWLVVLCLAVSAFLGTIYVLLPLLPLIWLAPAYWRQIADRLIGFWLTLPTACMRYCFNVNVEVSGDAIAYGQPALIIMNHRTRLDWLFFWNALYKIDPWLLTSEKISLKAVLKLIPGLGWAMGANSFIFLHRNWDDDRDQLNDTLDYYAAAGNKYQLLLYPEGTDKCPKATLRSHRYAQSKNLVRYNYVLHPKTTGFAFLVRKMRENNYFKCIYDVTVAYPNGLVQTELDLIARGACPRNIHFDIHRIDSSKLPETNEGLSAWLIDLWRKKEEKLREYYSKDVNSRHLVPSGAGHIWPIRDGSDLQIGLLTSGLFWLAATLIWLYFFLTVQWMSYYVLFGCSVYGMIYVGFGGLENCIVKAWKNRCYFFKKNFIKN